MTSNIKTLNDIRDQYNAYKMHTIFHLPLTKMKKCNSVGKNMGKSPF